MYPHQLDHVASKMNCLRGGTDTFISGGSEGPWGVLPSSGACWPTWWMSSSALGPVHLWGNKEKALAQRYPATCSPALPTPSFSGTVEGVSSAWDSALLLGRLSLSGFPLLSLYTLDRITCLKNHVSAKSPSHPNSPGRAVIPGTPTAPPASSKHPKLWKPPTGGAEWSRPSGSAEVTCHSPHTGPLDQCSPPSPSPSGLPHSSFLPALPPKLSKLPTRPPAHLSSPPSLPSPSLTPPFFLRQILLHSDFVHLFNRNMTVNTRQRLHHRGLIMRRTHFLPQLPPPDHWSIRCVPLLFIWSLFPPLYHPVQITPAIIDHSLLHAPLHVANLP